MDAFFSEVYEPLQLGGASPSTATQYRLSARRWSDYCASAGASAAIGEATDAALAGFARWRLAKGAAAATVNKDLRCFRAMLRLAASRGVIAAAPPITMLRETIDEPTAFLLSEIQAILTAASRLDGLVDSVPASAWWTSLVLAVYDTGGRIGAVLATRPRDVSLTDATIYMRPEIQKQRRGQRLALHAQTVAVLRSAWSDERELVWPWPLGRNSLYLHFRRLVESAGVETWRGGGSLWHRVRRSTASYLAAAGGDPTFQLGHSAASVTRRYLDPRICRARAAELIPRPGDE